MIYFMVLLIVVCIASIALNVVFSMYYRTTFSQLKETVAQSQEMVEQALPKAEAVSMIVSSVEQLEAHTKQLMRGVRFFEDPQLGSYANHCKKVLIEMQVFRKLMVLQEIDPDMMWEDLLQYVETEEKEELLLHGEAQGSDTAVLRNG
jgi:hypothetical protein